VRRGLRAFGYETEQGFATALGTDADCKQRRSPRATRAQYTEQQGCSWCWCTNFVLIKTGGQSGIFSDKNMNEAFNFIDSAAPLQFLFFFLRRRSLKRSTMKDGASVAVHVVAEMHREIMWELARYEYLIEDLL